MGFVSANAISLVFILANFFLLSGCVTTIDYDQTGDSGLNSATHQEYASEDEILSNEEILSSFRNLKEMYKENKSDPSYIYALDDFENKYGSTWNAVGLVALERGFSYYLQASKMEDHPSIASTLYEKSKSEYNYGISFMNGYSVKDKANVYSDFQRIIDYGFYCDSRFYYLEYKIRSLKESNDDISPFIELYEHIYTDKECPSYIRAWAVSESIAYNTGDDKFNESVNNAYGYIKNINNEEELIYIKSHLAWAESSLGNYYKAVSMFKALPDKKIRDNEKNVYNADILIQMNKANMQLALGGLDKKKCLDYWSSANSSKRAERHLISIINTYNELHDMSDKGRLETKPVYEKLTYSNEKVVVDYTVSPLLFKVQTAAERLATQIKKHKTEEYSEFYTKMLESVEFMQKSVDYRIKGYYLKKKDYRGEWEKAAAYMDESRGLYSEALQSAIAIINGRSKTECIIDNWSKHINAVSGMRM